MDEMKDPIKELEKVMNICGGQPSVFTRKDVDYLREMGIIVESSNPGPDLFCSDLGIHF